LADEEMKKKVIRTFGFERPEKTKFYEMSIGNESGYAYPVPIKRKTPKALIECNVCDGIERKLLGTSSFTFEGKKEADIYHHPRHVLASEKALSLLRDADVVGYKVCEVNIEDTNQLKEEHLNQIREIEIVGRCYKIYSVDNQEIKHCSACKKVPNDERMKADKGVMVVDEYWDGSDIFMFDYGLLSIIVTDKVKKIFEANGVNNVKFIPLSELKMR
jgi:hypothetical protein